MSMSICSVSEGKVLRSTTLREHAVKDFAINSCFLKTELSCRTCFGIFIEIKPIIKEVEGRSLAYSISLFQGDAETSSA